MHTALAACFQLLHPINASPPHLSTHLPGPHTAGPLLEAETHQGQGNSLFSFILKHIPFMQAKASLYFHSLLLIIKVLQGYLLFKSGLSFLMLD